MSSLWLSLVIAAAPRLAAVERRKIAILAYEAVIPERYAPVIPMEAGTTPEERAALWDELSKPNERGAVRIHSASDYKAAMDAAVAIADGRRRTVLLSGPSGGGKSTLAALMLRRIALEWMRHPERGIVSSQFPCVDIHGASRERIEDWLQAPPTEDGDPVFRRLAPRLPRKRETPEAPLVVWTTADEIFRLQSAPHAFLKPGEEPADPLAAIRKARVLVIDDLGNEPEQENVPGVGQIIRSRHDAGDLVTIVTSTGPFVAWAPIKHSPADEPKFFCFLSERYGAGFRGLAETTMLAVGRVKAAEDAS